MISMEKSFRHNWVKVMYYIHDEYKSIGAYLKVLLSLPLDDTNLISVQLSATFEKECLFSC